MDFEDILFIIVAIFAWVYSNFRKLQKQAVERSKEIVAPPDEPTVVQPLPVPVRREKKRIEKPVRKVVNPIEGDILIYDERKSTADFWKKELHQPAEESYIKLQEEKKVQQVLNTDDTTSYINIKEEIHSGNTDWRKAVIYAEILKPVHF